MNGSVVVVVCVCVRIDIDSLLDTLKSMSGQEEDEDLKMLEDMLKSNSFQEAKHVSSCSC